MNRLEIRYGGKSTPRAPILGMGAQAMAQLRPPTSDPSALRDLISFDTLVYRLHLLHPHFVFRDLPDQRVALGVPHQPTSEAVRIYDSTPSHIRNDVDSLLETPGPKVWLVSISRGWVSLYSDLLTSGTPRRIIARSVYSVLKACIAQGLFTWEQAERVFSCRFRDVPLGRHFIDVSVADWGKGRQTPTSTSSIVIASC